MARILVVDDDAVVRELLRLNFELDGHEVVEVADGEAAMTAALTRERPPDAILLDVMMPAPDGFDVCARLRGDPSTAGMTIVLLTARVLDADRIRGIDVGADAFVTKPFDPLELVELVEALVAGRPG